MHPDLKDIAALLSAVAWPITVLIVVFSLYGPLKAVLQWIAESMQAKEVKVTSKGIEIVLTRREVEEALNDIVREVLGTKDQLSQEQFDLFQLIARASGRSTVLELIPDFKPDRENPGHERLRKLRGLALVRPDKGGPWKPEKHPVVTRYGRLVRKVFSSVIDKQRAA
jgi:hypothetical protein